MASEKNRFVPLSECRREYSGDWLQFYPTEFLLPQIKKHIKLAEFPFIAERRDNPDWPEKKLTDAVIELGPWSYYFAFSGDITTRLNFTFNDDTVNFHRFRSSLISETVMNLLGRDAAKASVLDLACHCGAFSLDMAHRGVKNVRGIEYREVNLAQARFLKDYYRIPNASFEQGDVEYLEAGEKYDVVLCLGIMYHVVRPVDLVEFCYKSADRFAVIETICHKQPISGYVVVGDKNVNRAIEGTRRLEFHPTYRGIIETMKQVGFREIVEVVGTCDTRIDLFSDYTRRCFIAFK